MKKRLAIALPTTKVCYTCGLELPVESFSIKNKKTGNRNFECNKCGNKKRQDWAKSHPESRKLHAKKWKTNNHRNVWTSKTRSNHKINGCKIEFSSSWLLNMAKSTEHCYLCGRQLDWSSGKSRPSLYSPSLDRIDNEITLTENNVNIACFRCNRMKGASTLSEFLELCRHILERNGRNVS